LTIHDLLVFRYFCAKPITTNRLSAAFADKSGRMWFQAEDGGILYYEKGIFTVAAKPGELSPGKRSPFFDDAAGDVILNIDRRPFQFQNGKFVPFSLKDLPADCPLILTDREGGSWFSGNNRVYSFRDGNLKTFSHPGFFNGSDYQIAHEDRQGNLWIGFFATLGNKYSLLRIKDDLVQQIQLPKQPVNHLRKTPRAICGFRFTLKEFSG
jgi:hypothetical protein